MSSPPSLEALPEERRRRILDALKSQGRLVAREVARALGVSEDTVRRDLRDLADAGLLQRVHGGALPLVPAAPFAQRREEGRGAKSALARALLPLLRGRRLVLLDGGSTNLELARLLPPDLVLTVATNSPAIAAVLADHPSAGLVVIGGRVDRRLGVALGAEAVEAVSRLAPDLCVLGACGLSAEAGVTAEDAEEAALKRAMAAAAAEVACAASSAKLGAVSPYRVCPAARLSHVAVEADAPEEETAALAASGVRLHVAAGGR
ncbi:MAG TPA: DeoR/GlpR family DNA-binding transcription regulator [Azospirillaceae bacterium]|nr:DeoR/GlpR family DNA-binding transcription regulator [Azospirillaceae bacterium]